MEPFVGLSDPKTFKFGNGLFYMSGLDCIACLLLALTEHDDVLGHNHALVILQTCWCNLWSGFPSCSACCSSWVSWVCVVTFTKLGDVTNKLLSHSGGSVGCIPAVAVSPGQMSYEALAYTALTCAELSPTELLALRLTQKCLVCVQRRQTKTDYNALAITCFPRVCNKS